MAAKIGITLEPVLNNEECDSIKPKLLFFRQVMSRNILPLRFEPYGNHEKSDRTGRAGIFGGDKGETDGGGGPYR